MSIAQIFGSFLLLYHAFLLSLNLLLLPKAESSSFISSSPRSGKKIFQPKSASASNSKFRIVPSPSKTMFSPPYHKTMSLFGSKKVPSPKAEDAQNHSVEISPVRQRLHHNVALHGHKQQEFDEYDEDEFDPYKFIAYLPPLPRRMFATPCIPSKTCNKPTLVLDLDETLVHCSTTPEEIKNPNFTFEVEFNKQIYRVAAKRRPGVDEFLDYAREKFEVIIFTASQKVYADKLLDILDPKKDLIKHRVFRDSCVNVEGNYLKDLTVLGRDLSKTVIVDNSPQAFSYQLDNGIPILSWFEHDHDRELFKIIPLLDRLAAAEDCRSVLRDHFKLYKKVQQKIVW